MSNKTFDYIIVGSGTAGTVLANRLSSDPSIQVCLIEAGPGDKTPLVHIPSFVGTLMFHKNYGWNYKTTPQSALGGREILLPRGKILGGCSSTNGMAYFRGHPKDFDEWESMGNPGWSYRNVLPYFIRSENNVDYRQSPYHGTDGEMHISHVRKYNPMITPFLEATSSLGYPRCEDFNGCMDPVGFDVRQNAIHEGRRVSGVTAFLKPVIKRPNLTVVTECLVNRVLLENNRATGIDIELAGLRQNFIARREVVLCGGTYGSPALLLHSGIGDSNELAKAGIKTEINLPGVGKNLHDHPSAVVQRVCSNSESYGISWKALPRNALSVFQYLLTRKGQLAGNLFEVTGFLHTTEGLDRPDVQFVFMPANRPKPGFPFPVGHGYGINSVLLRPKSRGSVTLASSDPHQAPLIDTNFLGDDADLEPLLRGMRIARKILDTPQMNKYQGKETLPGVNVDSDEELKAFIKANMTSVHHPGGTCRMGDNEECVVDSQLRVRGIEGLRVADASVFPRMVSGNSNAPTVMVAEKAVDMILGKTPPAPIDPG
ncbi:MAG: GMC family oxidoreductase N-terminal domain-containing protein [Gammaproteobacteria bacterium]|nr:GMC family oxidoreductase N-terminal domain-containing protein [Gammaproteobacteria bacterium]